METDHNFNEKEQTDEQMQGEEKNLAFVVGDEVIGREGDTTIVRRRMIRTPVSSTAPHRMEAKYLIRKVADDRIAETMEYGSEKDLGPATEDDLKQVS